MPFWKIVISLGIINYRGSDALTLLSCNSDAQANDNVNSDVKVSKLSIIFCCNKQFI